MAAIADFQCPLTVRALQKFLWMVNFYHCFVPHAARLMRSLYEALKGKTAAFGDTKRALAGATMLVHPLPAAPIALTTDASDYAVGGQRLAAA